MFHNKEKSFKVDILPHQLTNKVPPMFQLKVEFELKLFTKLDMSPLLLKLYTGKMLDTPPEDKLDTLPEDKLDIPLEGKLDTLLEVKLDKTPIALDKLTLQDQAIPQDKLPTSLEVAELEEKLFTDNLKLVVMLLEEVESDNIDFDVLLYLLK